MDSVRTLVAVWLALLVLLALSLASAWADLGVGNLLANIGIAAIKAVLVAWFFMHLRRDAAVMRLAAVLGLIWLLFLLGLSLADTLTRPIMEAPGKALMTIATPGKRPIVVPEREHRFTSSPSVQASAMQASREPALRRSTL